jgi:hypothetical protein
MNCMDQALVTLLALNFFLIAILLCYFLPNTYINNPFAGILCRKCMELESLYGILWQSPALDWDNSLFCALRYKGTMVWALHRKFISIPRDNSANPIPALVHGIYRSYPYFQLFQQLVFSILF